MNKKISSLIMILFLLLIIIYMITCSEEVVESVAFSISIWKDNLFPTLFPFFVVSNLLMQYGFVDIIGKILAYPMETIFHLPKDTGFVLAASLFSGFPSGAKYTKDLVSQNRITKEEGARLLTFTHYSNPLFILGMIGSILLNNKKIGILILISHITSGLIVGYLFNYKYRNKNCKTNHSNKHIPNSQKNFGELLTSSIFDSLNTMFLLLGIVTIFLILSTILNQIISLPPILKIIMSGILEMTQGIKMVSNIKMNNLIQTILITSMISFGGLSVHMQVIGIISEQKIKYKPFFIARILHALLASGIVFILYQIFI